MPIDGHLIVPRGQTIKLTPFHDVRLVEVNLKPGDGHYMSGYQDTAQYMLAKPQVEELSAALEVSLTDSEEVAVPDHIQGRENIIRWRVTAIAEGTTGKQRRITKTYELDMRLNDVDGVDGSYIQLARMRKRDAETKAKDKKETKYGMPKLDDPQEVWDEWAEKGAMKEWMMTNRHRVRRAETGASLAASRTLLNIKSTYTKSELARPFIIVQSELNFEKALQYGGIVGDMALKTLGASFTRQLGLPEVMVAGLLESVKLGDPSEDLGPEDLFPAGEEEIENLISDMVAAGFPNRAACDQRTIDIFDMPMSQLTKRHVNLIMEYVELSATAKAKLDSGDFDSYKEEVKEVMRVCYANGSTIYDIIPLDLWDKIHEAVEA